MNKCGLSVRMAEGEEGVHFYVWLVWEYTGGGVYD